MKWCPKDGGYWAIITDDKKFYRPESIPENLKKEGHKVTFSLRSDTIQEETIQSTSSNPILTSLNFFGIFTILSGVMTIISGIDRNSGVSSKDGKPPIGYYGPHLSNQLK